MKVTPFPVWVSSHGFLGSVDPDENRIKKNGTVMGSQSHRSFPALPISSSSCSSIRMVTSSGVIPVVLTSVRVNSCTILRFCSRERPFLVFRITTGIVWFTVIPKVFVKRVYSIHLVWLPSLETSRTILIVHVHAKKVYSREIKKKKKIANG